MATLKGLIVISPPVVVALFLLLGLFVVGEETAEAPIRIRIGRRQRENVSGLPATSAASGRSLSGSSGWRVSLNNLSHRWRTSGDNNTDEWTAVVKNQPNTSTSPTSKPVNASNIPERLVKYPKKTLISKPVVGSIKRKGSGPGPAVPLSLPTPSPSTSEKPMATTPVPDSSLLPRVPISSIGKTYVQIERRQKESGLGSRNVSETEATGVKKAAGEYRAVRNQLEASDSGRAFMRRNGEPQQFPHHQHQYPAPAHQQQQQQYLPLPQQNGEFIDPYHPVLQHSLNQPPHNPLQMQSQPQQPYHHHPSSK